MIQRIASSFAKVSRRSVGRRAPLTEKGLDRQCEYRVEKARRFLSRSRFQSSRTGGGDHRHAEEEEGREEEALGQIAYVGRRGRAALPQECLPLLQRSRCYRADITARACTPFTKCDEVGFRARRAFERPREPSDKSGSRGDSARDDRR